MIQVSKEKKSRIGSSKRLEKKKRNVVVVCCCCFFDEERRKVTEVYTGTMKKGTSVANANNDDVTFTFSTDYCELKIVQDEEERKVYNDRIQKPLGCHNPMAFLSWLKFLLWERRKGNVCESFTFLLYLLFSWLVLATDSWQQERSFGESFTHTPRDRKKESREK